MKKSIASAVREQRLLALEKRLSSIVPDLTHQYTEFTLESELMRDKVRAQHAFETEIVLAGIEFAAGSAAGSQENVPQPFVIVDIGDSSGTHLLYLKALLASDARFADRQLETLSVNLDPVAVGKIKNRGLPAVLCRAENLHRSLGIRPSLCISLEMLEHLSDPTGFLDSISRSEVCDWLVITVPYMPHSRVGLHHIRLGLRKPFYPENTHIYELSPQDWALLFQHSGWRVVEERVYRQYPRRSFWRVMQPIWRRYDFEGFYGVVLKRDRSWANWYRDRDTKADPAGRD